MTHIEFIEAKIKDYDFGVPIYTNTLALSLSKEFQISPKEAAAAVSVSINRMMNKEGAIDLRYFKKGVYYRMKMTPFGETGIRVDALIADKYLADNNGYETGLALLHHMGLTTQIPAKRVFATNKAKKCRRADQSLGIYICPPKAKIDGENKIYLQVLDAIDIMEKAPVDVDHPYTLIAKYIQKKGLQYKELLSLAGKYYNKNTVLTLAQIAGERS